MPPKKEIVKPKKKAVKTKTKTATKKDKRKPPIKQPYIKSEEEFLNLFLDYFEKSSFGEKYATYNGGEHGDGEIWRRTYLLVTITGFKVYLYKTKKLKNISSVYEYFEKYPNVRDVANEMIEEHTLTGIALGDIEKGLGIFYLKNKFGYRDVKQIDAEVKQTGPREIKIINDLEK